jgi:hypothetical protein
VPQYPSPLLPPIPSPLLLPTSPLLTPLSPLSSSPPSSYIGSADSVFLLASSRAIIDEIPVLISLIVKTAEPYCTGERKREEKIRGDRK